MSLGSELKEVYKISVYQSDLYEGEFDKLKETLYEMAKTSNYYELPKDEYKNIMGNKRVFVSWLDENKLNYNGVASNNRFLHLTIEW